MKKVPILICVPFWEGDKDQAIDLLRIIAGLQAGHAGQTAHILLVARQDINIDPNMIKIISPKFNIFTYKSQSPLRGWPQGANGMFGSSMIYIANAFKDKYECVYWCEPDAIPVCPNWFWCLVEEWRKKHTEALIVGCRSTIDGNSQTDHVTGCALYHPNIARLMPYLTNCQTVAWDYQHRAKILQVAGSTPIIQNRYGQRNLDHAVINEAGVVVIHGVKSDCIVRAVKAKYKIT